MVVMQRQALDRFLLRVVDGCLAGVIFLVPLLMGGRHAIGQLALTVFAVVAAWAWSARQCVHNNPTWRLTWAAPLLLAGVVLLALQIVPLPPAWLACLAPHTPELLPLWQNGATNHALVGTWSCVSFTPAETLAGLVLFLDYALLFLVAVQRIERVEDVERLLRWCALSAVGMAVLGLVQLLTSNGKFFWFYEHPFTLASGEVKGSFTNRNHFANFLALGIGPLIWWLQNESHRIRTRSRAAVRSLNHDFHRAELKTYILALALGVLMFAGLLSLSRGGIAVMFLAVAICTVVCYWASAIRGRFVVALAAVGLLTGLSLTIFGFDRVSKRLEDFSAGSIERLDRAAVRRTIWATAGKAIPDYLRLGTGVGSFSEVYPIYTDALPDEGVEYTHAENGPLQVALETGAGGLGLVLAGIILCAWWCVHGIRPSTATRWRLCAAALSASLAAVAVHALVDFVWYVPACMALVAIFAACAARVFQLSKAKERREERGERREKQERRCDVRSSFSIQHSAFPLPSPLSSLLSPLVTAGLMLLGVWMIASRIGPAVAEPYWDAYRVARNAAGIRPQPRRNSAAAEAAAQRQSIAWLEDVVRWQPTHARAHLALAESHRRLFDVLQQDSDNPMSLTDIRDAAIRSHFTSRDTLTAWLSRAIGKHWVHLDRALYHTRQAIMLDPLQGRGYVYLADLSFLVGADAAMRRACIQQAVCVRPFDGAVLYAAGNDALLAGDTMQWMDYSKQAFRTGRRQQQQIMVDLTASSPAENLPVLIDFIVREFQPDLENLRFLHVVCAARCSPQQLTPLIRYRTERAQAEAGARGGQEGAAAWIEAMQLYSQLGNKVETLQCARNAVQCDSGNFDAHYQLGLCLLSNRLFAEAESHLRWCLQRTPSRQDVEANLRQALKGRIDSERRAAADTERAIAR